MASIYDGAWQFGASLLHNPFKGCPIVENTTVDVVKYACPEHAYLGAEYVPSDCHILSNLESTRSFGSKTKIMYVGDSLARQLYVAALCYSEISAPLDLVYFGDPFLREDYPCEGQCVSNVTYRNEQYKLFTNKCAACFMGIHSAYNTTRRNWLQNVEDNSIAVLSAGSWYNVFKGIGDPGIFNDTLLKVGQACKLYLLTRNIICYWVSLPPVPLKYSQTPLFFTHPDWKYFPERNRWSKHILSMYGVTYIDLESLLMSRKSMDPNVTADGMHWW